MENEKLEITGEDKVKRWTTRGDGSEDEEERRHGFGRNRRKDWSCLLGRAWRPERLWMRATRGERAGEGRIVPTGGHLGVMGEGEGEGRGVVDLMVLRGWPVQRLPRTRTSSPWRASFPAARTSPVDDDDVDLLSRFTNDQRPSRLSLPISTSCDDDITASPFMAEAAMSLHKSIEKLEFSRAQALSGRKNCLTRLHLHHCQKDPSPC
ncbi:hypothetical protein BKA81DRAFT_10104 [Phyllosticta paracitricarpa]|uniref:Uncharacterized protein n=1 Tax=Phyllosticta paracitricarpa TaxID=2016321 RepID=A0ABR1NG56_9PEZI